MKTTITVWHKDEDVFTIYDATYNPYSKGDILYFDFEEIYPRKETELRQSYKSDFVDGIIEVVEKKGKKYRYGKWKVTKVVKSIRIVAMDEYSLTIEVYVRKVRKIYWRFWRLHKWKQFWKDVLKDK